MRIESISKGRPALVIIHPQCWESMGSTIEQRRNPSKGWA